LSSFIGVLAGEALTRIVSPQLLKTAAGIAFIVLGIIMLVKRG